MQITLYRTVWSNGGPREVQAEGPVFLIGRAPECDLLLSNPVVSRRHCELLIGDDGVFVRDLGSRHGTFVNGERVEELRPLVSGDVLHVACCAFEVSLGRPRAALQFPVAATRAEMLI